MNNQPDDFSYHEAYIEETTYRIPPDENEEGSQEYDMGSPEPKGIESGFDLGALYVLVSVFLLLPFFFLPFVSLPFQMSKMALALGGTLIACTLFFIARLKEGVLSFPINATIFGAWGLFVVYLASALLSSSVPLLSFAGRRFEVDTVFFIGIGVLVLSLIPYLVRTRQQILGIYSGFLLSFLIIALYQGLRFIFGADFLSFDIFTAATSNLVGKWNDLGIFFGVTAVLALITLEGLSLHYLSKSVLYTVLGLSLVFLAIVDFSVVWIVLAVFSFGFLVYNILKRQFAFSLSRAGSTRPKKVGVSIASAVVLAIALLFLLGGDRVSDPISSWLGISHVEARPSWGSTVSIARDTYADRLLLGSGPNTFDLQWSQFKPEGINGSVFWNTDFPAGVGLIPSSFTTVGLVGGIMWLVFLGLFLYSGIRTLLFRSLPDSFSYYLSLSSFLVALYLWVFAVVYIPNGAMFLLAFFFTGMYLASLRHQEAFHERRIIFAENPRLGFMLVLGLTAGIIIAGSGAYFVGVRYLSAMYFQRAALAENTVGDEVEARRMIGKARELANLDTYARFASELELRRLTRILSDDTLSTEDKRAQFETALSAAIEDAQAAKDVNPQNHQNWRALGRVYQTVVPLQIQRSYENAKESYERALTVAPHNPAIYLSLAELEVLHGDNDAAVDYIRRALEEKRNYTAAVYLLAQIQVNENRIPEAIQSVEAAALLDANNPAVFFQLGLLKYNQGDYVGAVDALKRAIALNDNYANARYFLGLAYDELGKRALALVQFRRVLQTNPENEEVRQIIANLEAGKPALEGMNADVTSGAQTGLPVEGE